MPDPITLTIASIVIGVLCLLAICGLTVLICGGLAVMISKSPTAQSWRSLKRIFKKQQEADAANAQWKAAGNGLGYDTDSLE